MKKITILFISTLLLVSCGQKEQEGPKRITRELNQSITSNEGIETSVLKVDSISQIDDVLDGIKKPNMGKYMVVRVAQKNTTNNPYQTSHYRDAQLLLGGKIYNPKGYLHIEEKDYPGYKDCAVICDINPGETALESIYFDVPDGELEALLLANGQVEMKLK